MSGPNNNVISDYVYYMHEYRAKEIVLDLLRILYYNDGNDEFDVDKEIDADTLSDLLELTKRERDDISSLLPEVETAPVTNTHRIARGRRSCE